MLEANVSMAARVPEGLGGTGHLEAVEGLMRQLADGGHADRVGRMVAGHLATGGKRLRARLAFAAGEAMGVERGAAVPWAAACELLHNATLVHDDIQDGDRVRRGQPTVWAMHGTPQAINAGDLLLMLPFLAVERLRCDDGMRWRLARAVAWAAEETARGQSLELDLLRERQLDPASWSRAAEGKSGALLALPVEGAALLAGLTAASARQAAIPFARLGALYQLRDDLADCFGLNGRGARGNDLREGKVSALVVEHVALHPADTEPLLTLLATPRDDTPDAAVEDMLGRFRGGGAVAAVEHRIQGLETVVLEDPVLNTIPPLHAIASQLVRSIRRAS